MKIARLLRSQQTPAEEEEEEGGDLSVANPKSDKEEGGDSTKPKNVKDKQAGDSTAPKKDEEGAYSQFIDMELTCTSAIADPLTEASATLVEALYVEEGDKTRDTSKKSENKTRAGLLKDQAVDWIIDNILPGGRNGRLHKFWKLFGNEVLGIFISLTEAIMLFVSILTVSRSLMALDEVAEGSFSLDEVGFGPRLAVEACGSADEMCLNCVQYSLVDLTSCSSNPFGFCRYMDNGRGIDCIESSNYAGASDYRPEFDEVGASIKSFRNLAIFFIAVYTLRSLAETVAWGLSIWFQKYRRIGVTPLSLEWQPGNLIDLSVIPGIQIAVGFLTILLALFFRGPTVIAAVFSGIMMAVAFFTIGWTFAHRNELKNEGSALVKSAAITRLVAFTWEIWSVAADILYIATFTSKIDSGGSVGFLLFLELCRTAWELHVEIRDAKLTYICGKVLIPIRSVDIFESLNTYRAEALKSNAKLDGVIAVTSRWVTTDQTVTEIQNLVPVLGFKGPLRGGDWLSVLGGSTRDSLLEVKLAISPVLDSETLAEQDDRLYMITSPKGSTVKSGIVIEQDGSSSFSNNIVLNPDKCTRWQGIRIVN